MAAAAAADALAAFVQTGNVLLDEAEQESREGSLQDFIRTRIRMDRNRSLLSLIEAAAALYQSSSVKTKTEVEDLWRKNSHCAAVQNAVQDVEQLQVRWDAFLQRLDDELQLSADVDEQHQTKRVSPETALVDARTGRAATLEKHLSSGNKVLLVLLRQFSCLLCRLHLKHLQENQSLLDAHRVKVVVVSFGCQEGACLWLQDTGCQYDLLLDPDRKIYAAFGVGASLRKVLNFSNMLLYAEFVANKLQFPKEFPSIQDDMFQLGGDFLLDEDGTVLFSHCSQSPMDRPALSHILKLIHNQ